MVLITPAALTNVKENGADEQTDRILVPYGNYYVNE
jgi:hypothetical protein